MTAWADRSDSIDLLAAAWVAATAELRDVPKSRSADTGKYGYKYADLADALDIARPVLARHGLLATQTAAAEGPDVLISTTLLHASGQFVTAEPLRLPVGQTAQATGSAITYGRRYSLLAMLGLAAEDDDGASASPRSERPPERPAERGPGRSASSGPRSVHEAAMRDIVARIPKPLLPQFREDFRAQFGCGLSDLPAEEHAAAWSWMREHAPIEVADEEPS